MRKIGISLGLVALMIIVGTFGVIYWGVRKTCLMAEAKYKTNCQEALIKTLESTTETKGEKTRAIWAMGQLARKESLPVLRTHSNDGLIDQYELSKAIKWCEKGNVTSWMYGGF